MVNRYPLAVNHDAVLVKQDGTATPYFQQLLQVLLKESEEVAEDVELTSGMDLIAGVGLDGGGAIADGLDITFDLADTAVTPGVYGDASNYATFEVDQQGRLIDAGEISLPGGFDYTNVTLVRLNANASKTNNNFTVHSFASADIVLDPLGAWASGNPSRFTTPTGMSRAIITIAPSWASNSTGVRWAYARANADNAKVLVQDVRTAANESACGCHSTLITGLNDNTDYIDFTFAQTSGGNLNLTGSSTALNTATKIMILWLP